MTQPNFKNEKFNNFWNTLVSEVKPKKPIWAEERMNGTVLEFHHFGEDSGRKPKDFPYLDNVKELAFRMDMTPRLIEIMWGNGKKAYSICVYA